MDYENLQQKIGGMMKMKYIFWGIGIGVGLSLIFDLINIAEVLV